MIFYITANAVLWLLNLCRYTGFITKIEIIYMNSGGNIFSFQGTFYLFIFGRNIFILVGNFLDTYFLAMENCLN